MIGGALAVLVAGGLGAFMFLGKKPERAEAPVAAPALPSGRLALLERGVKDARFLAIDEIKPANGAANAVVVVVAKTAAGLDGGAAMTSQAKRVDCASGRVFDGPLGQFDFNGRLLKGESFSNGKLGRPVISGEEETRLVCAPSPEAGKRVFAGYKSAQREVQMPPDDFETAAAQRAADPDYWAWLCAAGARGRWREAAPKDCDKAVELAPASAETGLDRAFLNLKLGRGPASDKAFAAVLSLEPQNAMALYGRGLLKAIVGGGRGGDDLRAKGAALDPKVPAAIEDRYGFYIEARYKP